MELRIKEILKDRKMTVVSLADKIGIAQPSMSNIVNSKVMPSIDTLERIAEAIGVPITELFETPSDATIDCPNCGTTIKLNVEKSNK